MAALRREAMGEVGGEGGLWPRVLPDFDRQTMRVFSLRIHCFRCSYLKSQLVGAMPPTKSTEWGCCCGPPRWNLTCCGLNTKLWKSSRDNRCPPRLPTDVITGEVGQPTDNVLARGPTQQITFLQSDVLMLEVGWLAKGMS